MKLEILDLFKPGEWEWLRDDMLRRIGPEGVDRPYHLDFSKQIWGLPDSGVIDRRVVLAYNDPAFMMIRDILDRHFHGSQWFYIAYQRQLVPHGLHIDGKKDDYVSAEGYSIVIPMQQAPEFKFFLWNQHFDDMDEIQQFREELKRNPEKFIRVNDLSQHHKLRHCNFDFSHPITDYMELEGIYDYEIGTMVKFPKHLAHASHDWLSCGQHTHKDMIIVHTTPPDYE